MEKNWISIRSEYPIEPGIYEVFDCRVSQSGKAEYDGYDFHNINLIKGSLILINENIVTHWRRIEKKEFA